MNQRHLEHAPRRRLFGELQLEHRRLNIAGVATSALEAGEGPPLVLLHGGIQTGGAVWWRVTGDLSGRHRVVIPDLPGLGASQPFARLDASRVTDWLAELVRRTCAERPTLVAHSAPGGLAARFAAQHGDLLRQLVLVDTAGLGRFRPSPGFLAALLRSNLRPTASNVERFLGRVMADIERTRAESGEQWEVFVGSIAARADLPDVKRTMRQLVKAGTKRLTEAELRRIGVPTALVWGRHDPLIRLALAETTSATLGWPLRAVEDAGHLPHVERPEAFVEAVAALTEGA